MLMKSEQRRQLEQRTESKHLRDNKQCYSVGVGTKIMLFITGFDPDNFNFGGCFRGRGSVIISALFISIYLNIRER